MNKLTLKKGSINQDIIVNQVKYIIGNNYEFKFELIKILKGYFNSVKESEYSVNQLNNKIEVLFNEKKLNTKDFMFFEVNHHYNMDDDLKLSSKSIIARYLEVLFSQDEYRDIIDTLEILFKSLSGELDNSLLECDFLPVSIKQLIKLCIPFKQKDEMTANSQDLTYEETLLFQLELINYVSNTTKDKGKSIILIDVPLITPAIKSYLESMYNSLILVFSNQIPRTNNITDVMLTNKKTIDLANEEHLYHYVCDNNKKYLTIQEAFDYMNDYINKIPTENRDFIASILD